MAVRDHIKRDAHRAMREQSAHSSDGECGAPPAKRSTFSSIFRKSSKSSKNVQSFSFQSKEVWSDILTFLQNVDGGIVSLITQQLESMQMKVAVTLEVVMGKENAATGEVMESTPLFRSKTTTILNSGSIRESLDMAYASIEKEV